MSRIVSLQLGRAFAATSVVVGHTLHEAEKWPDASPWIEWLGHNVPFGSGVDVFFVISGFVMSFISQGRLDEPGYWRTFSLNRIARIVPAYWFYTTAMVVLLLAMPSAFDTASFNIWQVLRSYLFLPGLTAERGNPILQLGWTLNYEMFFYALFALAIALFGRRAVPALVATLVVLVALNPLFVDGIYALAYWTRPIILDFAAGMLLAEVFMRGIRIPRGTGIVLMILGVALLHVTIQMQFPPKSLADDVSYGIAATIFVAGLVLAPDVRETDPLTRGAVLVGDASYSLYLSHPFALTAVFLVFARIPALQLWNGWLYTAVSVAAAVVGSVFALWLIENPLTRLARGWLMKPGPRRHAAAASAAPAGNSRP